MKKKKQSKNKKLVIIAVIVLGLIIFFFPKDIGGKCGLCMPPPAIRSEERGCFGLVGSGYASGFSEGSYIVCYGIPISDKKCYTSLGGNTVEVPGCKEVFEWKDLFSTQEDLLKVCPACYTEAALFDRSEVGSRSVELCERNQDREKERCLSEIAYTYSIKNDSDAAEDICSGFDDNNMKNGCFFDVLYGYLSINRTDKAYNICLNKVIDINETDYTVGDINETDYTVVYGVKSTRDSCFIKIAENSMGLEDESNIDDNLSACENVKSYGRKDFCYYTVSSMARGINKTKAIEICHMIGEENKDEKTSKQSCLGNAEIYIIKWDK